jgi:hypothetical protein
LTRITEQLQQDSLRTARCRILGITTVAHFFRAQQGIQALSGSGRQSLIDAVVKAVFVGTQRAARDSFHTVRSRRFDDELPATRFQALDHRLDLAANLASNVIAQPSGQHLGIRDSGFAESKTSTDFSAQALDCTSSEIGFGIAWRWHVKLPAQHLDDSLRLDFGFVAREPSTFTKESQQNGKA